MLSDLGSHFVGFEEFVVSAENTVSESIKMPKKEKKNNLLRECVIVIVMLIKSEEGAQKKMWKSMQVIQNIYG